MQSKITETQGLIIAEVKLRLLEESVPRLKKCLLELSEEDVWRRPNKQLVSVGNLVLHLCGNVRQYIISALGGEMDTRERKEEFEEEGPIPKELLEIMVDELMEEVESVLEHLEDNIFTKKYKVQGIFYTGTGILMHVVEHFSYHVGQMTFAVKSMKNIDMEYYSDMDLNQTGIASE